MFQSAYNTQNEDAEDKAHDQPEYLYPRYPSIFTNDACAVLFHMDLDLREMPSSGSFSRAFPLHRL